MDYLQAFNKLKQYNQEHILKFYDKMSEEKQKKLLEQVEKLDLEQIDSLFKNIKNQENKQAKVEPIEYVDKEKLTKQEKTEYEKIGNETLSSGKIAAVTMAGGQGTRLRTLWTKRNI